MNDKPNRGFYGLQRTYRSALRGQSRVLASECYERDRALLLTTVYPGFGLKMSRSYVAFSSSSVAWNRRRIDTWAYSCSQKIWGLTASEEHISTALQTVHHGYRGRIPSISHGIESSLRMRVIDQILRHSPAPILDRKVRVSF